MVDVELGVEKIFDWLKREKTENLLYRYHNYLQQPPNPQPTQPKFFTSKFSDNGQNNIFGTYYCHTKHITSWEMV
jgi:hypothetical protein